MAHILDRVFAQIPVTGIDPVVRLLVHTARCADAARFGQRFQARRHMTPSPWMSWPPSRTACQAATVASESSSIRRCRARWPVA